MYLLGIAIHPMHPLWHFFGYKITGGLFHCYLTLNGVRHVMAIPMQSLLIMTVEEMHFTACSTYIRMQTDKLQKGTSTGFLDTNYQGVG